MLWGRVCGLLPRKGIRGLEMIVVRHVVEDCRGQSSNGRRGDQASIDAMHRGAATGRERRDR
jgi:hypothetical protein